MIHYALNRKRSRTGIDLPYVAGVFASRESLEDFVTSVPPSLRADLTAHSDAAIELPCFLIERRRTFVFVARAEIEAAILGMADGDLGNIYWIEGEWSPPNPGTDFMGMLPHAHVQREDVELVRTNGGVTALLARWFATFRTDRPG